MGNDVISTLSEWEHIAFDESSRFIERFCKYAWIITNVSWSAERMHFVFILDSGEHISYSVEMEEWLEFISGKAKK